MNFTRDEICTLVTAAVTGAYVTGILNTAEAQSRATHVLRTTVGDLKSRQYSKGEASIEALLSALEKLEQELVQRNMAKT